MPGARKDEAADGARTPFPRSIIRGALAQASCRPHARQALQ